MQNTYDDISLAPAANASHSNQTYKDTLAAFIPFFFQLNIIQISRKILYISLTLYNPLCSPSYSSNLQGPATHTNERLLRVTLKGFQWCGGYCSIAKTEQIYTRGNTPQGRHQVFIFGRLMLVNHF